MFPTYDDLDFDARDEIDDAISTDLRTLTTGLPPRPGVKR